MTSPQITAASLTGFDWFLVVVVVLSGLMAFRRGIIRVLFSIGGLIVGILLASWNYLGLAGWMQRWVSSVRAAEVMAFVGIVLGVAIVVGIVGAMLRKTVAAVGLGFLDRLLGGAFGLVRGGLIGVAVMLGLAAFVPDAGWVKNSRLAPVFLAGAHAVSFIVPKHLRDEVSNGASHLLQQTPELLKGNPPSERM